MNLGFSIGYYRLLGNPRANVDLGEIFLVSICTKTKQ